MSQFAVRTIDTYVDMQSQKLTTYQRAVIHRAAWAGIPQTDLAEVFGVCPQTISKIKWGSWQTTRKANVRGVTA